MRSKLMKNVTKFTLTISIIIIGLTINGCGQVSTQTSDAGDNYTVSTTEEAEPEFRFEINNLLDSNTYLIKFAAKNISDKPIKITFTKSPHSYYYTILDSEENLLEEYQAGVLDTLETIMIRPGESYVSTGFIYTKTSNKQLTITNQFSFIQNNIFNNKSISITL